MELKRPEKEVPQVGSRSSSLIASALIMVTPGMRRQ